MPDISMCSVDPVDCWVADRCYRHTESGTKPSARQAWSGWEPNKHDRCKGFWPMHRAPANAASEGAQEGKQT